MTLMRLASPPAACMAVDRTRGLTSLSLSGAGLCAVRRLVALLLVVFMLVSAHGHVCWFIHPLGKASRALYRVRDRIGRLSARLRKFTGGAYGVLAVGRATPRPSRVGAVGAGRCRPGDPRARPGLGRRRGARRARGTPGRGLPAPRARAPAGTMTGRDAPPQRPAVPPP